MNCTRVLVDGILSWQHFSDFLVRIYLCVCTCVCKRNNILTSELCINGSLIAFLFKLGKYILLIFDTRFFRRRRYPRFPLDGQLRPYLWQGKSCVYLIASYRSSLFLSVTNSPVYSFIPYSVSPRDGLHLLQESRDTKTRIQSSELLYSSVSITFFWLNFSNGLIYTTDNVINL